MCRNGKDNGFDWEQKCDARSVGSFITRKKTRECKDNTSKHNLDKAKQMCQALHKGIGQF